MPTSRFIANNGVHEYISQANVHESALAHQFADYRRSSAALAQARAKAEIATRGLVVTVTRGLLRAGGGPAQILPLRSGQRGGCERFLDISQKLENGGEVAHADVIKARIQSQQQQRDLQEAQLGMERSRLDLAVLLFPDFNQDFTVVDDLQTPEPLPTFEEVRGCGQEK